MTASTSPDPVRLGEKIGSGIGAILDIFATNESNMRLGALAFHDGGDWQLTDSSRASGKWELLVEPALALAHRQYPHGLREYTDYKAPETSPELGQLNSSISLQHRLELEMGAVENDAANQRQ